MQFRTPSSSTFWCRGWWGILQVLPSYIKSYVTKRFIIVLLRPATEPSLSSGSRYRWAAERVHIISVVLSQASHKISSRTSSRTNRTRNRHLRPDMEGLSTHGPQETCAHLAKAPSGHLQINGPALLNPGEVTPVYHTVDAARRKVLNSILVQAPTVQI